MNRKSFFFVLFMPFLVFLDACTQREEEALEVGRSFLEALHRKDFETAKSLSIDYSDFSIDMMNNLYSNVHGWIDGCSIQDKCYDLPHDWSFKLLEVKEMSSVHRELDNLFSIFFKCSSESYSYVVVGPDVRNDSRLKVVDVDIFNCKAYFGN